MPYSTTFHYKAFFQTAKNRPLSCGTQGANVLRERSRTVVGDHVPVSVRLICIPGLPCSIGGYSAPSSTSRFAGTSTRSEETCCCGVGLAKGSSLASGCSCAPAWQYFGCMTNNCAQVFAASSQVVRGARLRRARNALNRREAQGKKSVAEGARKKLTVFLTYTAPLPASDMSGKW